MSISEAALNVINSDFAADATQVDAILDAWAAKEKKEPVVAASALDPGDATAGIVEQFCSLTHRAVVNFCRSPSNWLGRLLTHTILMVSATESC
eukprot:5504865-Prymnesium_polylepis.1